MSRTGYGNYGGGEYSTGYGGGYGGGGGGGGGGGFVASQGGSQASPGSAAKSRGANTLRPVTIKQVLEASQAHPDAECRIDDVEISHITLVAKVRNVTEQATNVTYVVDDGTGVIDVKQWIDAESGPGQSAAQQLNGKYVRVLGQLKIFHNRRHVGAHSIRPVADYNEVQYHLLDCVATHLYLTRGPPEQFAPAGGAGAVGATGHAPSDVTMGGMGGGGASKGADRLLPNTTPTARKVFETIAAQPDCNEGVPLQVIVQKSGMAMAEVSKAVDELLAGGVAFTTIDDFHIAIMDF